MSKSVWTKTTHEFKVKWAGRKELEPEDILDMISDLLAIMENLENRK